MKMKDFVKCSYCEKESFIGTGESICPYCYKEGMLQWATTKCDRCGKTTEPQEILEEFIDKSQGLKVYVCETCVKEQEDKEDYYESILDKRVKIR